MTIYNSIIIKTINHGKLQNLCKKLVEMGANEIRKKESPTSESKKDLHRPRRELRGGSKILPGIQRRT